MPAIDETVSRTLPVQLLWQNNPYSWTENQEVLASQFLSLMGNDSDQQWSLAVVMTAPDDLKGQMDSEKLVKLVKAMSENNQTPILAFEPTLAKKSSHWAHDGASDAEIFTAMTTYLKEINTDLKDAGLQQFTKFSIEAGLLPRGPKDFTAYRSILDDQNLDNVELWDSGDWRQSVFKVYDPGKDPGPVPSDEPLSGVWNQVYSFEKENPLFNKPTNPRKAELLGSDMFNSISAQIHPTQLEYIDRNVQVFNWSGENTGSPPITSNQPVFGGEGQYGPVQGAGWDLDDFNQLLAAYSTAFEDDSDGKAPNLGIWAAENALDKLTPSTTKDWLPPEAYVQPSDDNGQKYLLSKYQYNLTLESSQGEDITESGDQSNQAIELSVSRLPGSEDIAGLGFYKLLDNQGRVRSEDDNILDVKDPEYLQSAKYNAISNSAWISNPEAGDSFQFNLDDNSRYALIIEDKGESASFIASLNEANSDSLIQILPDLLTANDSIQYIGVETNPLGSADFNDLIFGIENLSNQADDNELRIETDSIFKASAIGDLG